MDTHSVPPDIDFGELALPLQCEVLHEPAADLTAAVAERVGALIHASVPLLSEEQEEGSANQQQQRALQAACAQNLISSHTVKGSGKAVKVRADDVMAATNAAVPKYCWSTNVTLVTVAASTPAAGSSCTCYIHLVDASGQACCSPSSILQGVKRGKPGVGRMSGVCTRPKK